MDWERATGRAGRASVPVPATHEYLLVRVTGGPADPENETGSGERSREDRSQQSGPDPGSRQARGGARPAVALGRGGGGGSEFAWKWEPGAWGRSITGTPAARTSSRDSRCPRERKRGCSGPMRPGRGSVSPSRADHGPDAPWESEPRARGRAAGKDAPAGGGRPNPVTVASACSRFPLEDCFLDTGWLSPSRAA